MNCTFVALTLHVAHRGAAMIDLIQRFINELCAVPMATELTTYIRLYLLNLLR